MFFYVFSLQKGKIIWKGEPKQLDGNMKDEIPKWLTECLKVENDDDTATTGKDELLVGAASDASAIAFDEDF
jgi:hypothetical protein